MHKKVQEGDNMEHNVMVLKDGTELTLEAGASLGELRAVFADKMALVAGWDRLTKANLARMQIKSKSGDVLGIYENLVPADPVIRAVHERTDGLLVVFSLREKTDMEKLEERLAAVEETTDVLTMEALGGGEAL